MGSMGPSSSLLQICIVLIFGLIDLCRDPRLLYYRAEGASIWICDIKNRKEYADGAVALLTLHHANWSCHLPDLEEIVTDQANDPFLRASDKKTLCPRNI